MDLLLDTHIALWVLLEDEKLNHNIIDLVNDSKNTPYISIASLWELTIKQSNGKITLPSDFIHRLEPAGYKILSINKQHFDYLRDLPFLHKDPFDRILIAQAQSEELKLITRDKEILRYNVDTLAA